MPLALAIGLFEDVCSVRLLSLPHFGATYVVYHCSALDAIICDQLATSRATNNSIIIRGHKET